MDEDVGLTYLWEQIKTFFITEFFGPSFCCELFVFGPGFGRHISYIHSNLVLKLTLRLDLLIYFSSLILSYAFGRFKLNFHVTLHNKVVRKLSPNVTRDGLKSREKSEKSKTWTSAEEGQHFQGWRGAEIPSCLPPTVDAHAQKKKKL